MMYGKKNMRSGLLLAGSAVSFVTAGGMTVEQILDVLQDTEFHAAGTDFTFAIDKYDADRKTFNFKSMCNYDEKTKTVGCAAENDFVKSIKIVQTVKNENGVEMTTQVKGEKGEPKFFAYFLKHFTSDPFASDIRMLTWQSKTNPNHMYTWFSKEIEGKFREMHTQGWQTQWKNHQALPITWTKAVSTPGKMAQTKWNVADIQKIPNVPGAQVDVVPMPVTCQDNGASSFLEMENARG